MSSEKQIFTLKQVALSIQKLVAERYNRTYWVQAEVHKLNYTTKGHCYPELVHKEEGKIVTEMRATIWKSAYERISKNFAEVVKEPLRDGLNLLLLVKINFHPIFGMGLEVLDIDTSFSLGALQKERDETLKRLTKEGLLNRNQLLGFPLLPKRVAIISVDSSKGLSDFYAITKNNPWDYQFFFMLFPAVLNGDAAVQSIQRQLARIERVKEHFDCVLIIRGGGGEIGMSCYNNFELAKTIACFPLPVMTGIGHSTNITVCEMIAYRNAITPTELGEFLIQSFHDYVRPLSEAKQQIIRLARVLLQNKKTELRNELRFASKVTENFIMRSNTRLTQSSFRLKQVVMNRLDQKHYLLRIQNQKMRSSSKRLYEKVEQNIEAQGDMLLRNTQNYFIKENRLLTQLEKSLRLVDPIQVLKRGYSLTLKDDKLISPENPIKEGDLIETHTAQVIISSQITKIEQNE